MDVISTVGGGAWTLLFGYILPFLAVLTVVVFIHELGHFLVGRWCGVGVHVFSIGFGPEIFGFNDRHGTRWRFAAVPLGGYVKFAGDMNGASVPDSEQMSRMNSADRAVSFHHKPVWKRAAIVAAGPIANFILAIAIFSGILYVNGRQVLIPRVDVVQPGSAAERAGFLKGDIVVSINGRKLKGFSDLQRIVGTSAEETLAIVVDRNGEMLTLQATPDRRETETAFGRQRIGLLGLQATRSQEDVRHLTYGPLEAVAAGAYESWYVVDRTFNYLGKLVTGRESTDQLSGPIRIAQVSGQVADLGGLGGLVNLVAILSVSIGLINLFPVPMLDGGHLLFYGIEALRGRPLSERAQEIGFRIGFALVIMLMLFATWNDVMHLGSTFSRGS
jgi:regulator of sigma E protease